MSAVAQNDMDLLSLIFLQVATSQNENKNFEMNQFCDKFMQNLVKRRQNLLSAQNPVSIRAGTWIPSEFLENLPISASLVECYEKYLKNSQVASDANADFNFFKRRRISVLRERLKKNVDQLLHM